jgi:hypothetical protein
MSWETNWTDAADPPMTSRTLRHGAAWASGTLGLFRQRYELKEPEASRPRWIYTRTTPALNITAPDSLVERVNLHAGGFHLLIAGLSSEADGWTSQQWLVVPFWAFLVAAIPPGVWWRRYRGNGARGFGVEVTSPAPVS